MSRGAETSPLALRRATPADAGFLFELRNDPVVRAASLDSAPVDLETHRAWVAQRFADPLTLLLVVERGSAPVGQVRFDLDAAAPVAEISVALAGSVRGRGLAPDVLRLACDWLFSETPVTQVVALIRPENAASIRAFSRAGFVGAGLFECKGRTCVRSVLTR